MVLSDCRRRNVFPKPPPATLFDLLMQSHIELQRELDKTRIELALVNSKLARYRRR